MNSGTKTTTNIDNTSTKIQSQPGSMSVRSLMAWACWLGIGSGAFELAIFFAKCRVIDPRNMNVSRHLVWMFPVAGLILVGLAGLGLTVGSRVWKRLATPGLALFVLFLVSYAGLLFRAPIYTSVCVLLAGGLAWRTASFVTSRFDRFDRLVCRTVVLPLALVVVTVVASFGRDAWREHQARSTGSTALAGSKNVILIVLDTVRADSLGLYGYARDTTPNLSKIARRGVRFDQAFSTAPWTAPSHASMFTGRWPHELSVTWTRPLDATYPTLAETLSGQGYSTAGFVANTTYCSEETGLARGFAYYEDYDVTVRGLMLCSSFVERALNFVHKHPALASRFGLNGPSRGDRKDAARINHDFLAWLDGRSSRVTPFFAFLNFYDAHHPYLAPETTAGSDFGRKPSTNRDFRLLKTWWESDKKGIKPDDVKLAKDSYDRCIAYLDEQVGRLFDDLDRRGVLDNSVVIVTADHGEHLGERQLFGHGCSVYRPELHVPLMVIAPGRIPAGRVVDTPVSLRNLPSTVLDLVGLRQTGSSPFPGQSLASLGTRTDRSEVQPPNQDRNLNLNLNLNMDLVRSDLDTPPYDDPNQGRSPGATGPMTSVVSPDYHYIRSGNGREELYELKADPNELRNLAQDPDQATTLDRFRLSLRK